MPTVTKFPTANQAAGGVFNGSWTNPNNAHADDGVYATAAPGKNQEYAAVWNVSFSTSDIAAGATVNSVTIEVQWKVSTTASVATLRSTAFADSAQATAVSASPGVNDAAEPTTDTVRTYSATPTLAQLRDLWVRAQILRGSSNTAVTASLDYVKVTVNYTDPPPAITGTGSVTLGFSTAGSGSSALPSSTGTGGVAFGLATSGSGTFSLPARSGSGGVAFGLATSGSGATQVPGFSGSGSVAFGFATGGAGAAIAPQFTGSGGIAFGIALGGSGTFVPGIVSGSGGVSFIFALGGAGTVAGPGVVSGAGGVVFAPSTSGSGAYTSPAITGSGGVTFGFSISGGVEDRGPWLREGVWHLGHKPNH